MLDVARKRACQELRDLGTIARRNPLTIAGICIGLLLLTVFLHGVEGRIGSVERTTRVDHNVVRRVSACATQPHSTLCLVGITRALRACLADEQCRALIVNPPPSPRQPSPDRPPSPSNPVPPVAEPAQPAPSPGGPHHPTPRPPEGEPKGPEPPTETPVGNDSPEEAPQAAPPEPAAPPPVEAPALCVTANPLVSVCLTG